MQFNLLDGEAFIWLIWQVIESLSMGIIAREQNLHD